jgi:hypothetical protein
VAASLTGGLEECFIINRLDVPVSLHRCLVTANIIESPHAGFACTPEGLSLAGWWHGQAVDGGSPSGNREDFRKIMGFRDLWALDAILNGSKSVTRRKAA